MTSLGRNGLSYRDAGVDIAAGDRLVEAIRPLAKSTDRPGTMGGLGGFGALFDPRAAGFTLAADRLGAFRAFIESQAADRAPPSAVLDIDGQLSLAAATPDLVATVERAGPYGTGHREPRFAFGAVRVAFADVVGSAHVRCTLADSAGVRLSAIAFRAASTPVGAALLDRAGAALDVSGVLRADTWQGRVRVQLQIDDVAATAG